MNLHEIIQELVFFIPGIDLKILHEDFSFHIEYLLIFGKINKKLNFVKNIHEFYVNILYAHFIRFFGSLELSAA